MLPYDYFGVKPEMVSYENPRSPDSCAEAVKFCQCNCSQVQDHVVEKTPFYGQFSLDEKIDHWIWSLLCRHCKFVLALWVLNTWWPWEELLKSGEQHRHGIFEVSHYGDRLILYILSQVCYRHDQVPDSGAPSLLPPPPTECGRILWQHGHAAGFYTLKKQGSPYSGSQCDVYAMPVVDMIYIRKQFQRQGLATQLLSDAAGTQGPTSLGFSYPVSKEMTAVLCKYLIPHPEWRDHFWEVKWIGSEGYRTNIWFKIKAMLRQKEQSE